MKTKTPKDNFILFLGTGAGDFHGEHPDCPEDTHCGKARVLGGKNIRRAAALLVAPDVVVDFGKTTPDQLKSFGIPRSAICRAVFTHGHYDHCHPPTVLDFAARGKAPLSLYGNTRIRDALDFAARFDWKDGQKRFVRVRRKQHYAYRVIQPEKTFRLGDLKITPVLANHDVDKDWMVQQQVAMNLVIQRGGRTLFYGLDSSIFLPGTLEFLKRKRFRIDLLVLDATWGNLAVDLKQSGHLNFALADQTVQQMRREKALKDDAKIIYSHLSVHEVPPHDQAAGPLAEQGVILAYDGMKMEF